MTPEALIDRFAQAIVDRAYDRAEEMLAPWVRATLPEGGLRRVVRLARGERPPATEYHAAPLPDNTPASMREHVADYAEANRGRTLATYDGSGAPYGPPSFPVDDAMSDDSFRGAWCIEFMPDEDLDAGVDYSYQFYAAVITAGQAMIGYLEPMD